MQRLSFSIASAAVGLALVTSLTACQTSSSLSETGAAEEPGYPSLHSVPTTSRPSSSVEERRRIVETLIEERDAGRRQTAVVRHRSGLNTQPPPTSSDADLQPEDVIPDAPEGSDDAFRLTPGGKVRADSVYRGDVQFEDGSLDDFIRQLKRDTRPRLSPTLPPSNVPKAPEVTEEDDVSSFLSLHPSGRLNAEEGPIWLAAFAPVLDRRLPGQRGLMIRLAAADEEPGVFCGWFGWVVAWSSMCVDETVGVTSEGDDFGADVDQEGQSFEDDADADGTTPAEPSPSTEPGRQRAERRLSEEDAAEAIEEAGRSALAPVTGSLEKLRDFIRSRRSDDAESPSPERTRSVRAGDPTRSRERIDRPPVPRSRPEVREDIIIVDEGETFGFARTPTPAFKPSHEEPGVVILPPEGRPAAPTISGRSDPPPRPHARPSDQSIVEDDEAGALDKPRMTEASPEVTSALAARAETRVDSALEKASAAETASPPKDPAASEALAMAKLMTPTPEASPGTAEADPPPTSILGPSAPEAGDGTEPNPYLIAFEPNTAGLPEGAKEGLITLLATARAQDRKIHIIGEASTNHLARRRATDVGAALVQLGATVEILEYDHQLEAGADQVRLVIRSRTPDPLFSTVEPSISEK